MALNITKATAYLKNQKRQFENQLTPEAAKTYTSLLGEIKNLEREISSPEYENQLRSYAKERTDLKSAIEKKQEEREELLCRIEKGRSGTGRVRIYRRPVCFCLLKSRRGYLPPVPGSRTGRLKEITPGTFCIFRPSGTSAASGSRLLLLLGTDARQFLPALDAGNH